MITFWKIFSSLQIYGICIPAHKDMYTPSKKYQISRNALGTNRAPNYSLGKEFMQAVPARDFGNTNFFFDTTTKLTVAFNPKCYKVLKEWKFAWKEKWQGDQAVKTGSMFYGFKNKKITFDEVTKNLDKPNTNLVRPSKNYRILIFWERKGGDTAFTANDIDIGFKVTGTVYWKDTAPF